jgi:DNA-binding CsgD family transcriptional regulator
VKKTVLIFGLLGVASFGLLKISAHYLSAQNNYASYTLAVVAVVFLAIGIWMPRKQPETPSDTVVVINQAQKDAIGLSKREYEVLLEIAAGYSNKEIADRLFVTESTIKTHVSNVLSKLDTKRRTQAVKRAKELELIPM